MQVARSLSVQELTVRYGSEAVLNGVDLPDIRPGGITAFAGPNGAGKSTLLRAIAGMVKASGEVSFLGRNLLAMSTREQADTVGFMPQGVAGTNGLTALDSIIASLRLFAPAMFTVQCRDAALSTLERIGIINLAMRPLGQLSGGQRQLASLGQSLVREPKILLLDEPTSALDLRHQSANTSPGLCRDCAGIVRQSIGSGLAVVDIGGGDGDLLDQSRIGVGADMGLKAMNRWSALMLDPTALFVILTGQGDDRCIDKRASLSLGSLSP